MRLIAIESIPDFGTPDRRDNLDIIIAFIYHTLLRKYGRRCQERRFGHCRGHIGIFVHKADAIGVYHIFYLENIRRKNTGPTTRTTHSILSGIDRKVNFVALDYLCEALLVEVVVIAHVDLRKGGLFRPTNIFILRWFCPEFFLKAFSKVTRCPKTHQKSNFKNWQSVFEQLSCLL